MHITADNPVSIDVALGGTAAASSDLCSMTGVIAEGKSSVIRFNNGVSVKMSQYDNSTSLFASTGGQIYAKGSSSSPVRLYGSTVQASLEGSLVDLTLNAQSVFGTGADAYASNGGTVALRTTDGADIELPGVSLKSGDLTLGAGFSGTADFLAVSGLDNNINVGSGAKMVFKTVAAGTTGRLNLNGAEADLKNIIIPQTKGLTITYNDPYVEPTNDGGSGGCSAGIFGAAMALLALPLLAVKKRRR